jgi:hypothetical protein
MQGLYWSGLCGKKMGTIAGDRADAYGKVEKSVIFVSWSDANGPKRTQIVYKMRRAARDALSVLIMENVA